ncbi:MAG: polysaccharide deacetylase family protein [Candidatus Helarchaeota archaeon]
MPFFREWKKSFDRILSELKYKSLVLCVKCGVNEAFRLLNKKKLVILIYHGITSHDLFISPYHLPLSIFKKHLAYLKKKRYTFITLTEWLKIKKTIKKLKKRYAILTFDDGYKSVLINAYPLMKKLGIKGCFYLVTDVIDKEELLWDDYIKFSLLELQDQEYKFFFKGKEKVYSLKTKNQRKNAILEILKLMRTLDNNELKAHLTQFKNLSLKFNKIPYFNDFKCVKWDDLKKIELDILEIGSHTSSHCFLDNLKTDEQFEDELLKSKKIIENAMSIEIKHLSYPHGAINLETIQQAKRFNYKSGVTIERELNDLKEDPFRLKRVLGYRDMILFKTHVSGLYPFLTNVFKK